MNKCYLIILYLSRYINNLKNYIFHNLYCYFLNFLTHAKNYRIKTMNHNNVKNIV